VCGGGNPRRPGGEKLFYERYLKESTFLTFNSIKTSIW